MLTRTSPYAQRVTVPDKSIEEVYEAINIWLRFNNCIITRENSPTDIEAHYSAEVPVFQTGPRDSLPKDIQVRVSGFGTEVMVYFTITQSIRGKKTGGYIYWGTKLLELYEELGVEVTDMVWLELFPENTIKHIISRRTRWLAGFFLFSLAFIWFLWNPVNDSVAMYVLVIMMPIVILFFWDMQGYRRLLKRPV